MHGILGVFEGVEVGVDALGGALIATPALGGRRFGSALSQVDNLIIIRKVFRVKSRLRRIKHGRPLGGTLQDLLLLRGVFL